MDSVFPFFMICVLPLIWTAAVFMFGRWSASYRIRMEPRNGSPYREAPQGEYYKNFEGEI